MSGHVKWEDVKASAGMGNEAMASYVYGYALALRDMAKDLNDIETVMHTSMLLGARGAPWDGDRALGEMRAVLLRTVAEAKRTAEALKIQLDPLFQESVEQMRRGEGVEL